MKQLLGALLTCTSALFALEEQPWFGDLLEFHFLGKYSYEWFDSVDGAKPALSEKFHSNLIDFNLDFSPSPVWSVDTELQFADTSKTSFHMRSLASGARFLWFDDIIGDPLSLTTGLSLRFTPTRALQDVSCPSHGQLDIELNASIGKEFDTSDTWRFRTWAFAALGHANRGSPWVRAATAFEMNVRDIHKWGIFLEAANGYGRHCDLNPNQFYGYGTIRSKTIDLHLRYGQRIGVWGTLRLEYVRRLLAKAAPEHFNGVTVSFLIPFSL